METYLYFQLGQILQSTDVSKKWLVIEDFVKSNRDGKEVLDKDSNTAVNNINACETLPKYKILY